MYHLNLLNINKKSIISLEKEIIVPKNITLISRTDLEGNIIYYNLEFAKISGYSKRELINMPHNILRHPDMPKAIFYFIWKNLLDGRDTYGIIKNRSKDGNFYWLYIKFIVQRDIENRPISFLAEGKSVQKSIINKIEPLYKNLLKEEKKNGLESSIKKLHYILNKKNIASYNDYILKLIENKKHSFLPNLKF
jgi:PAS domain S-box-containing protein